MMNERIIELAVQSELSVPRYWMDNNHDKHFDGLISRQAEHTNEVEKFAELIIKECVEAVRLVPYSADNNEEFGDESVYQESIKQHFGVEW